MGRSSFEKSIDARFEGFNARDAFNEQAFEPRKSIIKKMKKKEGLREYSEKEVAEMSGDVKYLDLYGPCSWKEFRSYDKAIQIKYINSLIKLYPDINSVDLSFMFNRDSSTISYYLNSLGIHFPRGCRGLTSSRLSFRKKYSCDYAKEKVEENIDIKNAENSMTISDTTEEVDVDITSIKLVCDVSIISDLIKKYGFKGKVKITVEKVQ